MLRIKKIILQPKKPNQCAKREQEQQQHTIGFGLIVSLEDKSFMFEKK